MGILACCSSVGSGGGSFCGAKGSLSVADLCSFVRGAMVGGGGGC